MALSFFMYSVPGQLKRRKLVNAALWRAGVVGRAELLSDLTPDAGKVYRFIRLSQAPGNLKLGGEFSGSTIFIAFLSFIVEVDPLLPKTSNAFSSV